MSAIESFINNNPRSIYQNFKMTLRLSGHSSIIFGLVFMLKSLLENARQRSRENLSYTHDRTQ